MSNPHNPQDSANASSPLRPKRTGATVVWLAFAALFVLHQDGWNWGNRSLVLGWLPAGLAWHAGFSLAAALLWVAAIRWAWPADIERWAEESDTASDKHQPR